MWAATSACRSAASRSADRAAVRFSTRSRSRSAPNGPGSSVSDATTAPSTGAVSRRARRALVDRLASKREQLLVAVAAQLVDGDVERDLALDRLVPLGLVAAGAVLHVQEAHLDRQHGARPRLEHHLGAAAGPLGRIVAT